MKHKNDYYQRLLQVTRDRRDRAVQVTTCPTCKSPPGAPCHGQGKTGRPKPNPHHQRINRLVYGGPDLTVDLMLKKAAQPQAAAAELAGVDLGALFNIDLVRPQP